jgi:hypothetical protein
VRLSFVAQYDRILAGVDVLAMPTIPMTAPRWLISFAPPHA